MRRGTGRMALVAIVSVVGASWAFKALGKRPPTGLN